MWFEELTGFVETTGDDIRSKLTIDGEWMRSSVNGKSMRCGRLQIPSVHELRQSVPVGDGKPNQIQQLVTDVRSLLVDPSNAGSLFQVASQLNLLEMASPSVIPEQGVDRYERDFTQGPVCAVACGAGTIYRNWFVKVGDQIGQTEHNQIDSMADLGAELDNSQDRLWEVQNGYALATESGLHEIAERVADPEERDKLVGLLRIGLQLDTEVTIGGSHHIVSQAYCSGMPINYSAHSSAQWEPLARLVLDATYEATFLAAIQNAQRTGNHRIYLTLVGGGVFGNRVSWIVDAIERAMNLYPNSGLDVVVVSYSSENPGIRNLVQRS